jgi:hypothetical protein
MAVYLLKIFEISTIKEEENKMKKRMNSKKTAAVLSRPIPWIILRISGLPVAHRVGEDRRNLVKVISDTGTVRSGPVLRLVLIHLHL